MNKAVITGMGITCAAGSNKEEVLNSIKTNKSGLNSQVNILGFKTIVGKVKNNPLKTFKISKKMTDKSTELLLTAAYEAIKDSNIDFREVDKNRIGVVIGSNAGGYFLGDIFYSIWAKKKILRRFWSPKFVEFYPVFSLTDKLCKEFEISGINITISNGCSSGTFALGYAMDLILLGKCDIVIACGVEPIHETVLAGFKSLRQLSQKGCSPFCCCDGISVGEGAGVVILESLDSAIIRKANVYAEILGYSGNCDPFSPVAPNPSGKYETKVMNSTLINAGIRKEEIDCINAHGTGIETSDLAETRAIRKAFGEYAYKIPISATKSIVGHTFGACGAIEVICSVLAMNNNILLPTLNFGYPCNKEFNLDYVANQSRTCLIDTIISNTFAFAGNNSCIAFGKLRKEKINESRTEERIVITGIGIVTPYGLGVDKFKSSILNKKTSVRAIEYFSYLTNKKIRTLAAIVPMLELSNFLERKKVKKINRLNRMTRLVIGASLLAIGDANLEIHEGNNEKIGIILGAGVGPIGSVSEFVRMIKIEKKDVSPLLFPKCALNATAGETAEITRIKGYNSTIADGRISSFKAICYAYDVIKRGYADAILVCGVNEYSSFLLDACRLLSIPGPIGEIGGGIILESLSSAKRRQAKIYGEILGYELTHDGKVKKNNMETVQAAKAMETALKESNKPFSYLDLICRCCDDNSFFGICERNAINKVFNQNKYCSALTVVDYSATVLNNIGETLGASGLVTMIVGISLTENKTSLPHGSEHVKEERLLMVNSCSWTGSFGSVVFSVL